MLYPKSIIFKRQSCFLMIHQESMSTHIDLFETTTCEPLGRATLPLLKTMVLDDLIAIRDEGEFEGLYEYLIKEGVVTDVLYRKRIQSTEVVICQLQANKKVV